MACQEGGIFTLSSEGGPGIFHNTFCLYFWGFYVIFMCSNFQNQRGRPLLNVGLWFGGGQELSLTSSKRDHLNYRKIIIYVPTPDLGKSHNLRPGGGFLGRQGFFTLRQGGPRIFFTLGQGGARIFFMPGQGGPTFFLQHIFLKSA